MRSFLLLLLLLLGRPLFLAAQQHPVYKEVAPWSGAVLESAEITYRGTTATMVGRQPRLVATERCCLLMRELLTFDQALPNLLPTEGQVAIGLTSLGSKVLVTFRLQGTSFCVNHEPLRVERDGTLRGRVMAVLPNENLYLDALLAFDATEQKGRWDLVTGDGTLSIRLVFRAGQPEDGPLPPYLTQREANSIRRKNQREVEPHCAE